MATKGRRPPTKKELDNKPTHAVISRDFDDRALFVREIRPDDDVRIVELLVYDYKTGRNQGRIAVSLDTLRRVLYAVEHPEIMEVQAFTQVDPFKSD